VPGFIAFFFFIFLIVIVASVVGPFLLIIVLIGKNVEMDGMRLRHLEFAFALRATQDFALFDLIFIQVDFGVALRAPGHGVSPPRAKFRRTAYYITLASRFSAEVGVKVANREYPERPMVGVGGVVISNGRTLLIRRGGPPLQGQWSIPGGMLEVGETLLEGVRRELLEETGIEVRVLDLIEVFERINLDGAGDVRYHFVVLDYLCDAVRGEAHAGSDVVDVAWASPEELAKYSLTETATRVILRAFEMAREKAAREIAD
jgi:8-oxo-dGTP diphosphatase